MPYEVMGLQGKLIGQVESPSDRELDEFFEMIQASSIRSLMNEFLEITDREGEPSGTLKLRDLIHADGDWHRTFHLHVYSVRNNEVYTLLQRRHPEKDVGGGMLDVLLAGHYGPGETSPDQVILREAEEELGINVSACKLISLGQRKIRDTFNKGVRNFEIQDVYICQDELDISKCVLKSDEVVGVRRVKTNDLIRLLKGSLHVIESIDSLELDEQGEAVYENSVITRDDIRPAEDHYHLKAAIITYWLARGEDVLSELGSNPYDLVKDKFPLPLEFE